MCSTGTNAYTTDDHTCYELTTAGSDGMKMAFPVFMNHILNPTLSDAQFQTEVYHLDGEAKHQGVVYCEMASRENTEADMLDLHLRKSVYENLTTYSQECGGLTKEIAQLTNKEIKEYHKKYYHLDNITAIICGQVIPEDILSEFLIHEYLYKTEQESNSIPRSCIHLPVFQNGAKKTSKTIYFPSEDENIGSIGYSFRGPPSEDIYSIYALEILFRFFNDNPSSPFSQAFVERLDPYASDIDLEIKSHIDSPIFFVFSGVPTLIHQNDGEETEIEMNDDDIEADDSSTSEEGDDISSIIESEIKEDLFQENVFYEKLEKCLTDFVGNGPESHSEILAAIDRHRKKMQEALEDSPHELFAMSLIPDLTRFAFSTNSTLNDTRFANGKPSVGTRLDFFSILDRLEKEPLSFWKSLANKYLIENSIHEVKMIPSAKLADEITKNELKNEKERLKLIGKKGLAKIKAQIESAIQETKVKLTQMDIDSMPPVPDVTKAPKIKVLMENIKMDEDSGFKMCQVVKTETSFVHLGFAFNSVAVNENLRPYFVLFQELLFQSPLALTSSDGSIIEMDYREVSKYSSTLFVSHECGVGFGNSIFSASYLSQLLTLFITGPPQDFERMIRFASQVLLFSVFTKERILSIAKNLLSSLVDIKRDGNGVLSAVVERVSISTTFANRIGSNDHAISIFKQEEFLKNVITQCKEGKEESIINSLNMLRSSLVKDSINHPSFIRIGVPHDFSFLRNNEVSTCREIAKKCFSFWNSEFSVYSKKAGSEKRKSSFNYDNAKEISTFPFPRIAFSLDQMEKKFSSNILVPVAGLSTSYLSQIVSCDLFKSPKHEDYFPTLLLAELLSKAEGPLYTGIRGKGFAYGVGLNCYLWSGQLSFELYRSSEPKKALLLFHQLLEEMATDEGFNRICTVFEIETAQASIAYRCASNQSTASSLISTALRTSLQGYKDLDDYSSFIEELYKVTQSDLKRVYKKYFSQFLTDSRITIMTCPASDEGIEKHLTSFESMNISFNVKGLSDFEILEAFDIAKATLKDISLIEKSLTIPSDFPVSSISQRLSSYALFKQAAQGPITRERLEEAQSYSSEQYQKKLAWARLGNLDGGEAKKRYISLCLSITKPYLQLKDQQISNYISALKTRPEKERVIAFFKQLNQRSAVMMKAIGATAMGADLQIKSAPSTPVIMKKRIFLDTFRSVLLLTLAVIFLWKRNQFLQYWRKIFKGL